MKSNKTADDWLTEGNTVFADDKKAAITCYNKAIELNPKYATAYNNKGVALKALGDTKAAITCYNKAIEINPKYASAYHNKGNALYALGDTKSAIEF